MNRIHNENNTTRVSKTYTLLGADKRPYVSSTPGLLGGNCSTKIYGRLDCRTAISALSRWGTKNRVFFADEQTAIEAGYRPCGSCLRDKYLIWKSQKEE